ncbi:MAG TPA: carboxymuconolactone decarboxylase family protein [Acidimicrobiales bacterium]|nr:carboxymuconolactone decarboxylase family protein [Acidimicrobiales bacterium]
MARLPYLEAEQSTDPESVARAYAFVTGLGRPVAYLYKVLANQPAALQAFLGMSHYVRDTSSLDKRLLEAAVLATARELDQPYERAHHERSAVAAGVPAQTVEAIVNGRTETLGPLERAVVAYAEQVADHRDVDETVLAELRRELGDAGLTDLVVSVAWYHLCAAILGPLHVELEPEYLEPASGGAT